MKKFKAESKKLLDLMINSIYTNKEIFLRELVSNASDALDKLYFKAMQENLGLTRDDFEIVISKSKDKRTLSIRDNGIGMNAEDLENNLGVICHSGTLDFKKDLTEKDIEVIGQFGVGFYSAFMVAEKVEVNTKKYGEDKSYLWVSDGAEGYSIKESDKDGHGTEITLYLKPDTEDEKYSEYLEEYVIRDVIKKYSDYIRYPINMFVTKTKKVEGSDEYTDYTENEVLNSRIPLWKKAKNEIQEGEYNAFYREKFHDWEEPVKVITSSVEGAVTFTSMMFIPAHAPYDYYTKEYEKGLQLYTNGVLIMEKCGELLPDCFGFVKGVVDSADLSLNISRETLQHNRQVKVIANNLEKKIKSELKKLLDNERKNYEKFFQAFGTQLKFGAYANFGVKKELLQDLLLFYSYNQDKYITLDEYVEGMKEDDKYIYYASGSGLETVKNLPQLAKVKDCDVLLLCEDVDEFCIKVLAKYKEKEFKSVSEYESSESENSVNEQDKDMLAFLQEKLSDRVKLVRTTDDLGEHAVCLSTQGELSLEMEKILNAMPQNQNKVVAEKVLEINNTHKIYQKLKEFYDTDKEKCATLADVLLTQAELLEGVKVEKLGEYCDKVCDLLV